MSSFLSGMFGGVVAWIASAFVGQPLVNFWSLRTTVAQAFARYDDSFDHNPDANPLEANWLAERKQAYETSGAALVAFAVSNPFIAARMNRSPIAAFRYYPRSAGSTLLTLAATKPGTQASAQLQAQVVSALKFRYWSSKKKRWMLPWASRREMKS